MPALMLRRATPVRGGDLALVRVLEASIETLKAENEILRRAGSPPPRRGRRETPRTRNRRSPSFPPSRDGSGRGRPPLNIAAELGYVANGARRN